MTNKIDPREAFFKCRNDVVMHYGRALGYYGLAVYAVLLKYRDNKTNLSWPGIPTITHLLNGSRSRVIKAIKLLCNLELIDKRKKRNNGNMYRILAPKVPIPEHLRKHFPPEPKINPLDPTPLDELFGNLPDSYKKPGTSFINTSEVSKANQNKTKELDSSVKNEPPTTKVVLAQTVVDKVIATMKESLPHKQEDDFRPAIELAWMESKYDLDTFIIMMANIYRSALEQRERIALPKKWYLIAAKEKYLPFRHRYKYPEASYELFKLQSLFRERENEKVLRMKQEKLHSLEAREIENDKPVELPEGCRDLSQSLDDRPEEIV